MSSNGEQKSGISWTRIYWIVWWIGTALIVMGWLRIVSSLIAWIGFGMTAIATITSLVVSARARSHTLSESQKAISMPMEVNFADDLIQVTLEDKRVISAPLDWYPKLLSATDDQRSDYELDRNGIFWPQIDTDVSLYDLLAGNRPASGQ